MKKICILFFQPKLARRIISNHPNVENHSQRFRLTQQHSFPQYHTMYSHRLSQLKPFVLAAAKQKWDSRITVLHSVLSAKEAHTAILLGTLYKQMTKKPNAFDLIAKGECVIPSTVITTTTTITSLTARFTDTSDSFVLEDETGRINIKGVVDASSSALSGGVVVAVLGQSNSSGEFVVEDILLSGMPSQPAFPLSIPDSKKTFLAIVCGLDFTTGSTQLLGEYLSNHVSSFHFAKLVRVVIGGLSATSTPLFGTALSASGTHQFKRSGSLATSTMIASHTSTASSNKIDIWLYRIVASGVPVDVMSGPNDPCNAMLPQQPIHPSHFPNANKLQEFRCVTNPYEFSIDGVRVLGVSGQTILDQVQLTPRPHTPQQPQQPVQPSTILESRVVLDVMQQHLNARHLAPTCPDTLDVIPFTDSDPFVLLECPHIYFSTNCLIREAASEIFVGREGQRVLLVSVPKFCFSQTAVLIDLASLECHQINFGTLS
eukprot:c2617_g1_i1.p1 GENE.c2617_g1_i1~~c2617_g1_i1.p1  ORF type:complete len:488 (-),score=117.79 c2617_g1_i1:188-1651(-)